MFVRTLSLFATLACLAAAQESAQPPAAKKVPKSFTLHGEVRVDDYFWLREKESPEVRGYLEAENAYTAAVMKPHEPLRDALYKETLSRIKQTDSSAPYRRGNYFYYSRTTEGQQYGIMCRKRGPIAFIAIAWAPIPRRTNWSTKRRMSSSTSAAAGHSTGNI